MNKHTEHCYKRQIWGDGECECGIGRASAFSKLVARIRWRYWSFDGNFYRRKRYGFFEFFAGKTPFGFTVNIRIKGYGLHIALQPLTPTRLEMMRDYEARKPK